MCRAKANISYVILSHVPLCSIPHDISFGMGVFVGKINFGMIAFAGKISFDIFFAEQLKFVMVFAREI